MRLLDRLARRYGSTFWEGQASGAAVLTTSYGSPDREAILPNLVSYANDAYGRNAVVFGAILARLQLFSEARFKFQRISDGSLIDLPPRASILEEPWANGTTGELLARMIQDVDLAGNCYLWNTGSQLVRLRPDQVTIVSHVIKDDSGRSQREVVGYLWDPTNPPGGPQSTSKDAEFFTVDEVAHWSPIPDPVANFKGMSWMTPIIREVMADNALTDYKLKYLDNAATPNLLLKYKQQLSPDSFERLEQRMRAKYGGVTNAFKTLVLDQGADHAVVGNSLEQMNFTTVQAAGENRILIASGVPGIVVGSKEGLMAATYSNYIQAMRRFADITMMPLWRSACACLGQVVTPPAGQRLWFDVSGIPALRQGEQEKATTMQLQAQAIAELVRYGFDPESAVKAVPAGDMSLLTHKGLPMDVTTFVPKAAPPPISLPEPGQTAGALPAGTSNGSSSG